MERYRYSEGGSATTLTFPEHVDSSTANLQRNRRTLYIFPNASKAVTSGTSQASECFVKRQFSEKLQQFMLSYAYSLVVSKVLSGEV